MIKGILIGLTLTILVYSFLKRYVFSIFRSNINTDDRLRDMQQQLREMNRRMEEQQRNMNAAASKKKVKSKGGDYIDYEEMK